MRPPSIILAKKTRKRVPIDEKIDTQERKVANLTGALETEENKLAKLLDEREKSCKT